jgi:hypothetical protein
MRAGSGSLAVGRLSGCTTPRSAPVAVPGFAAASNAGQDKQYLHVLPRQLPEQQSLLLWQYLPTTSFRSEQPA